MTLMPLMTKNMEQKHIDQLMDEADLLIQQINSDALKDMEEEHQLLFEKHAEDFKKLKSKVQSNNENTEAAELKSSAEGMHEAILDIITAMKDLKNKFL